MPKPVHIASFLGGVAAGGVVMVGADEGEDVIVS